eukprot:SAG22_NODE_1651_length_3895_cov_6.441412_2_plen_324_part_00
MGAWAGGQMSGRKSSEDSLGNGAPKKTTTTKKKKGKKRRRRQQNQPPDADAQPAAPGTAPAGGGGDSLSAISGGEEGRLFELGAALPARGTVTRSEAPPDGSAGDYFCLQLGPEWQAAAPGLVRAAEACYGCSDAVTADGAALAEALAAAADGSGAKRGPAGQPRYLFYGPRAPIGLHVTLRPGRAGSLAALECAAAMAEVWHFAVVSVAQYRNPKLGQPSQWDRRHWCARWFAFEIKLLPAPAAAAAAVSAAVSASAFLHVSFACYGAHSHLDSSSNSSSSSSSAAAAAPQAATAAGGGGAAGGGRPGDSWLAASQARERVK